MYLYQFLYLDPINSETPSSGEILPKKENDINKKESELNETIDDSNEEVDSLQQEIQLDNLEKEVKINNTYEIIQGTVMYNKLKDILKDESEIIKFSNSIHAVVHKYILDYLPDLNSQILEQINMGLQFSLMETLMQEGEGELLTFFEGLNKSDKKNTGKSLFNIINLFKNGGGFYSLLKKSQNFIDYVSYNKLTIGNGENINELTNAKKFKDILQNPIWDEPFENIKNKNLQEIGFTVNTTDQPLSIGTMTIQEKQTLQSIINNPDFPINEKIIETISSGVKTASNLLDKRYGLRSDATGLFNSLYGISNQLGMFGIKWPIDMMGLDKDGKESFLTKALNFVLSLIGFSGGIMGLHNSFIKENIEKGLLQDTNKQETIKNIMRFYQKTPIESENFTTVESKIPKINVLNDEQRSKIPNNYDHIKDSLKKGITSDSLKSLDPNIIRKLGSPRSQKLKTKTEKDPKTKEKIQTITEFNLTDSEIQDFIEKYIQQQIPVLIETEGFLEKIKGPDSFMLALTGNLIVNEFFVEGMKIGVVNQNLFMEISQEISQQQEKKETLEEQKQTILDEIEKQGVTNKHYKAYILATAEGESGFQNIKEIDGENKDYGKIDDETGKAYYGRGYVQLTRKKNYEKFNEIIKKDNRFTNIDIVNNPDIILENNELAAYILVYGMIHGEFRTKEGNKIKLSDFDKKDGSFDYIGARKIVNGSDKAQKFQELAQIHLQEDNKEIEEDENIDSPEITTV